MQKMLKMPLRLQFFPRILAIFTVFLLAGCAQQADQNISAATFPQTSEQWFMSAADERPVLSQHLTQAKREVPNCN